MRQLVGQVRILLRKTHGDRAGDTAARLAVIDVLGREVDESAIAELEAEVGGICWLSPSLSSWNWP